MMRQPCSNGECVLCAEESEFDTPLLLHSTSPPIPDCVEQLLTSSASVSLSSSSGRGHFQRIESLRQRRRRRRRRACSEDQVEDVAPARRSGPTPGSYGEESGEKEEEEQTKSILTFVLSA